MWGRPDSHPRRVPRRQHALGPPRHHHLHHLHSMAPLLLIVCALLLQGACARPRLRHSHRKFLCSKCAPGWGVQRACSALQDTRCRPCASGAYSPHHSFQAPCWLCSRCGPGLFEARRCRPGADTVCDDCERPGGVPSGDFLDKCGAARLPT